MSEMAKTLAFIAAAALALMAAFMVAPRENSFDVETLVGQRLNEFDIDAPKRLKIVKFNPETASTSEFEVAEENGLWTIPSKQGYPADAAKQMAEAATCLIDREVLRVAASSASQHAELGVVDPTSSNLDSQDEGVGIRVTMSDNNNDALTDMIVGKGVKDAEGQYYVRRTNQDVVYVVKLDPEKLSTNFQDWIEDDLLKINSMDIRKVAIKDYSAEMMITLAGIQMDWDRRAEMSLTYDSDTSKWQAESLQQFDKDGKKYVDFELADDEELNQEALKGLADGLDDLLLVDVERKPTGLSADLKAGDDFLKDNAAASSLMARGFAPVAIGPNKQADILSSEGEVTASMQNGVEYVLRFGNLQMDTETGETKSDDTEEGEIANGDNINRYLFVMARFNEDMIEKPELEDLPALPEDTDEKSDGEATSAADEPESVESDPEASETEKPASEEEETDESESDEKSDGEAASTADEPESNESDSEASETENPASEDVETDEPESDGEAASAADESASDESAADESDSEASDSSEADTEEKAKADELADIIEARKSIEEENQRRLDEYQAKIKEGKERVAELNRRFGDWYYVISNDVYQNIHVGLDKLVKKKETEGEEGDAASAAGEQGVSGLPNLPLGGAPAPQ